MFIEDLREYCLKKPFVTESFPFDSSTLVFKVAGKMFALADVDDFPDNPILDFVFVGRCDSSRNIFTISPMLDIGY